MRTIPATLLILALTGPALAATDEATGFGVEPPFPFSAVAIRYDGSEVTFGILSMTRPTPPDGDPYLCLVGFNRAGPLTEALGQKGLNEINGSDQRREMMIADAASQQFEVASTAVFNEHGATGIEMIGTPKDGGDVRLFLSSFSTTIGSVSIRCATTADQIESATEVFRTLRHSIILPMEPE